MRILVLGASGLIGHRLFRDISETEHELFGVIHGKVQDFPSMAVFKDNLVVESVDAREFDVLTGIIKTIRPDVILNCIGITKRKKEVNDPVAAISVNSLLPHKLVQLSNEFGFRVIHFSTDCVFDGKLGGYTEESPTTGEDAYGKTKALGEINYPNALTIRSSFIGREISGFSELLEWVISQKGNKIKGFTKAMYSGVSTIYMSKIVLDIIENYPSLSGLQQLATNVPVSKYDLLCIARDSFGLDVEIDQDNDFEIKPTLNGQKLQSMMGIEVPSWQSMMDELAHDQFYNR